MRVLQSYCDTIDTEYKKERLCLERKYQSMREPYLSRTRDYIAGLVDVPSSIGEHQGVYRGTTSLPSHNL